MDLTPELYLLSLPSSLAPGEITRNSLESFATIEAELRRGQINDVLHELRLALGEKSLSFWAEGHNANSQRTSLRAWSMSINMIATRRGSGKGINGLGQP